MSAALPGFQSEGQVRVANNPIQDTPFDTRESIEVIARLRETKGDIRGRAFVLNLDQIIVRLGLKWESKSELVSEHLRKSFSLRFSEPNWCAQLNDNLWLAVTVGIGSRGGALSCAEIWRETGQFFVGDVSDTRLPLYEVRVEDAARLKLRLIDIDTYFDRGEDFGPRPLVKALGATGGEEPIARKIMPVGSMTSINRPSNAGSTVVIAGRDLLVACSLEPVFELKNLSMIGHRLEPLVVDRSGNVQLDGKALKGMDWGDREKVDLANIEQGLGILRGRTATQRKILIVVPVAFSTMASTRGRTSAIAAVSKAAAEMGMKVLYEIRGLSGVPAHRIVEITSLVRPYCMTIVGHVGSDKMAIQAVRQCGFSGICLTYDGAARDPVMLQDYLQTLTSVAKSAAGACMIQGFDNLRQMAIARLAGVSHASVKASALQAAGNRLRRFHAASQ